MGEGGILGRATNAVDKTEKAKILEELELVITDIQIKQSGQGNKVNLETLKNGQLESRLEEITVELENNEIIGEYKGYEYTIDNKLKVTVGDPVTGISLHYKIVPKGYTNEEITLTIIANSTNGEITNIQVPESLTLNADKTCMITENGIYEFTVTDSAGETKTKRIDINTIDRIEPQDFVPKIDKITLDGFTIIANVEDKEDETGKDVKSGIGRYKYCIREIENVEAKGEVFCYTLDGGVTWNKYTQKIETNYVEGNLIKVKTIYKNEIESDVKTVKKYIYDSSEDCMNSNALNKKCYDRDYTTFEKCCEGYGYRSLAIEPECWTKYFTVDYQAPDGLWDKNKGHVNFLNIEKNNSLKSGLFYDFSKVIVGEIKAVRSVSIPIGAYWVDLATGMNNGSTLDVYEAWCSDEDLTGQVYEN